MQKKKSIWKKTMSVVLSLVMVAGLSPVIGKPLEVKAGMYDDGPSVYSFAPPEYLMAGNYSLDNTGWMKKVEFGMGGNTGETPQTWYIAGYDKLAGNLVLICDPANPVAIQATTFSYKYPDLRVPVSNSQGLGIETCTYKGNVPTEVGQNHYGISKVRAELKELEEDTFVFTSAEQKLMEDTTIYTYDRCNSVWYSTTDKLYLPHYYSKLASNGYSRQEYLVVGANAERFPDRGLYIPLPTSSSGSTSAVAMRPFYENAFWLRTPFTNGGNGDVNYKRSSGTVGYTDACSSSSYYRFNVVPAFALDLSSVLFASSAPRENYTSTYYPSDAVMNFRLDDSIYNKIGSTIEYTEDGVKVTKGSDASDLYLCAVGYSQEAWEKEKNYCDYIYSTKITKDTELTYEELNYGMYYDENPIDKDNAKIWIETTKDNLTYAKMAENIVSPKADVQPGSYTSNQEVTLSTTEDATIYYTTNGEVPNPGGAGTVEYDGNPIPITGQPGGTVTHTIMAIAVSDAGNSMVKTFKYVITLPHAHDWSTAWTHDSQGHWHECTNPNCTVQADNGKDGYGAHTEDEGTITAKPTTISNGTMTYKCSVCGYVIRTESIPKLESSGTGSEGTGSEGAGTSGTGTSGTGTSGTGTSGTGTSGTGSAGAVAAKPAAKNTVLTAASQKCTVKVTSSSLTNPTVAYVKSTNSKATTISIPATIKINNVTYKVTSIAASAFANNKKITKITIGKNVTTIGKNAFKNCTKLKTVTINSTVLKSIGATAFSGDKNLKTVTIKSSKLTTKTVGKNAFKGTNSKLVIKAPKKKVAAYKKFFKTKGNKKVTVR
ncbi:MAG: leucine-rich repeat protein [Lachnospiraceae bacterium]|nr:leucine-rich repeat protein [Lachnospiraceae bacterium]